MPLKTLHDLPPYGFFVYVPETGWESPKYIGLDAAILEVEKHRKANSRFGWPTDRESIRNYILAYTEQRLRSMPGGEQWLAAGPGESPPANFLPRLRSRQALAGNAPAAEVKKPVAGIALIADWLGSGLKPVEQSRADQRASICARCILNIPHIGLTNVIADGLHLLMEAKAHMKLSTPHDNLLETCKACSCRNVLKVWTPIEHIRAHTTPEIFAALAEPCWIRDELKIST